MTIQSSLPQILTDELKNSYFTLKPCPLLFIVVVYDQLNNSLLLLLSLLTIIYFYKVQKLLLFPIYDFAMYTQKTTESQMKIYRSNTNKATGQLTHGWEGVYSPFAFVVEVVVDKNR